MKVIALKCLLVIGSIGLMASCLGPYNDHEPEEVVLRQGESVSFNNKSGAVTVRYVDSDHREFDCDGVKKIIKLKVRPRRWLGDLGLYTPGASWPGKGYRQILYREAEKNFDSRDELWRFMYQGSGLMDWQLQSAGIFLGLAKSPGRYQISIDVYRLKLNGQEVDFHALDLIDGFRIKPPSRELKQANDLRPLGVTSSEAQKSQ